MSENEREEGPICFHENCTKPVQYMNILILEDDNDVCADHLPPNAGEYFWEVFWKNGRYHYPDGCTCMAGDCRDNV